jgi:hypothetical protein
MAIGVVAVSLGLVLTFFLGVPVPLHLYPREEVTRKVTESVTT